MYNRPNKKPPQNITAETLPYCTCLVGLDARVVLVAVIAGEYLTVSLSTRAWIVNDRTSAKAEVVGSNPAKRAILLSATTMRELLTHKCA